MRLALPRAVAVTFLPLAIAAAALGVREATRPTAHGIHVRGDAREFVPPPLFLAALAAPVADPRLRVDSDHSAARVSRSETVVTLRVSGTMRILRDDTLGELELDLAPGAAVRGWPRDLMLHVRGTCATGRSTGVPGVFVCHLRGSVVLGGTSRDTNVSVSWLRLPGGTVEMHAVATIEELPIDLFERAPGWMLRNDAQVVVGMDLVLRADR